MIDIKWPIGLSSDGRIHPREDVIYMVSYPRCGSTWFRYCFEFITKRASNPAIDLMWETGAELPQFLYSSHHFKENPYGLYDYSRHTPRKAPLRHIWLRRDPIEAITSQVINSMRTGWRQLGSETAMEQNLLIYGEIKKEMNMTKSSSSLEILKFFDTLCRRSEQAADELLLRSHLLRYYNLLICHLALGEPNGLALRYEDLLGDPEKTLLGLINYLVADNSNTFSRETLVQNLDELLENYAFHQNSSMNIYRSAYHFASSTQKGTSDFHYYSDRLSPEFIELFKKRDSAYRQKMLNSQEPEAALHIKKSIHKYLDCYDRRESE